MTQEEKACEVLNQVFSVPRQYRVGVHEAFLRNVAKKRWVGKDELLQGDVLMDEVHKRVAAGQLRTFKRGSVKYYAPPKVKHFL